MNMADRINVGIVGTQFMGRAHSNAYRRVADFFDLPAPPVLRAACDVDVAGLKEFSKRFGWQTQETSWQKLVSRDDIERLLEEHGAMDDLIAMENCIKLAAAKAS